MNATLAGDAHATEGALVELCLAAGLRSGRTVPRTRARSPAGELLHTALIRLPLKGVEVALGYGRLLRAQGPVS